MTSSRGHSIARKSCVFHCHETRFGCAGPRSAALNRCEHFLTPDAQKGGRSTGIGIGRGSRGYFDEDMAEPNGTGLPPNVETSDHPDVSVLVKAARALWEDKDIEGAVRWFARAAEAASDVGDDRRALELARAVADLKDKLASRESTTASRPPPTTMPPPPSARKPSLPPKPPPIRHRSVSPAGTATATTTSVPPNAKVTVDSAAPPPSSTGEAGAASLHVSVKTSVRDPELLIVRILKKGQAVPSGCGEAILAPTGRGFDLGNPRG